MTSTNQTISSIAVSGQKSAFTVGDDFSFGGTITLAYSDSYGVEMQQFIGHVLTVGERRSELRRVIKEALMVNPYIRSVDRIDFEEGERGRVLNINVELTTIYGTVTI